jgi:hypothetical protein
VPKNFKELETQRNLPSSIINFVTSLGEISIAFFHDKMLVTETHHFGSSIRQVAQCPQAVLHQPLAGVSQMNRQSLKSTSLNNSGLVAGAD